MKVEGIRDELERRREGDEKEGTKCHYFFWRWLMRCMSREIFAYTPKDASFKFCWLSLSKVSSIHSKMHFIGKQINGNIYYIFQLTNIFHPPQVRLLCRSALLALPLTPSLIIPAPDRELGDAFAYLHCIRQSLKNLGDPIDKVTT